MNIINIGNKKMNQKTIPTVKNNLVIIDAGNMLLKEDHTCEACSSFPFASNSLSKVVDHVESHSLTFKEYRDTFIGETIIEDPFFEGLTIEYQGVLFIKNTTVEKAQEERKKPFAKINGEIVKRITISGIESYERKLRIKKIINNEKVFIGGLRANEISFIPEAKNDFFLDHDFHKSTISLLSFPGFTTVLLTGDTGLGKTETVMQICSLMRQPVVRIKITGNTKVKDIFQDENYSETEKKLVKVDKGIIQAMKMGATLLVDEISAASPSVNFIFYELLEEGTVIDFDGKKIIPKPTFKVVFTDNRIGNVNYFKYHGTFEQSQAFINRIRSVVVFDNLKPMTEKKILLMKYPFCDEVFIDKLIDISKILREENKKGNFQEMFPIRTLQNISLNYQIFKNAKKAFEFGYLNKISEIIDRDFVSDLVQRFFGSNN